MKKRAYRVSDIARRHTDAAMAALADIVQNGQSESARISAAIALLDRAWGKPAQSLEMSGKDGSPIQTETVLNAADLTDEALAEKLKLYGFEYGVEP